LSVIIAIKGGDGKPDGVIIFTENVTEKEAENSENALRNAVSEPDRLG